MAQGHIVQEVANQQVLHLAGQWRTATAQTQRVPIVGDSLEEIASVRRLCKDIPEPSEKHLAAYVLGMNEDVQRTCEKIANEKGLILKVFSADSKVSLSVPEWLAMFRDASYVVTDSFHGTVFSIVFGKEFKCIYNEIRGAARFESLLNLYNSGKLEEKRQFSLNWLKNALET